MRWMALVVLTLARCVSVTAAAAAARLSISYGQLLFIMSEAGGQQTRNHTYIKCYVIVPTIVSAALHVNDWLSREQ